MATLVSTDLISFFWVKKDNWAHSTQIIDVYPLRFTVYTVFLIIFPPFVDIKTLLFENIMISMTEYLLSPQSMLKNNHLLKKFLAALATQSNVSCYNFGDYGANIVAEIWWSNFCNEKDLKASEKHVEQLRDNPLLEALARRAITEEQARLQRVHAPLLLLARCTAITLWKGNTIGQ